MIIMHNMAQNRRKDMNEKIYKTMAITGAGNIALGIIVLISGIACGILVIVNGAKILKRKSDIIF